MTGQTSEIDDEQMDVQCSRRDREVGYKRQVGSGRCFDSTVDLTNLQLQQRFRCNGQLIGTGSQSAYRSPGSAVQRLLGIARRHHMLATPPGSRSHAVENTGIGYQYCRGVTRPVENRPNPKTHNRKQKTTDVTRLDDGYGFRAPVTRGCPYCNPRS
jgi:hypothetical protein